MLRRFLSRTVFILLFLPLSFTACKKDDQQMIPGKVTLQFNPVVDGQDLVLDDQEFTNSAGNKYKVEKLKYYVSKLKLTRSDGSIVEFPDGYFLIEETSLSNRREISLENVPAGNYSSFSFAIGVDSARNFSTEMVGDLNPNNDMAWNWVSGYKFFMLEGKFTTAANATDAMVFHIGGNRSYRTIGLSTSSTGGLAAIQIKANSNTIIELNADINKLFNATTTIDLNTINAIMQPGEEADKIANNYATGMFTLKNVRLE
ncbi:hypothetical protein GXP67_10730 [Rhodocytophaga rosea]|uniref:Copper-binding protein MbnP-like domain-containing protein n=1 Tax=Rhodocytophaga rosea TaxID=2704465 RepID=A0A6C0GGP6_9BACT|nr:MbnP family protein [Rhodocytophaga rosea]QHT67089.1 hypothetical protein GXP67_10730 [Rhodocytophaga rosea]